CELHIEQGPRLDQAGLALGVVDAIVGIYHARVTVRGRADHAGATVMTARADALAAAAEIVLEVERIARSRADAVGTVSALAARATTRRIRLSPACRPACCSCGPPAARTRRANSRRSTTRRLAPRRSPSPCASWPVERSSATET